MKKICSWAQLAALHPEATLLGEPGATFAGFAIDSRRVQPGELFIALATASDDGHAYVTDACRKGAAGALVHQLPADHQQLIEAGHVLLVVPDTLAALAILAANWRQQWEFPVVAVTGSSGKTTVSACLRALFPTSAGTTGNYNNHIGLPLSMLGTPADAVIGIFELGMSGSGEIDALAELLQPQIGLITNVGSAHIGKLGSFAAILEAKLELARHCSCLIVDGDGQELLDRARQRHQDVLSVGFTAGCQVFPQSMELRGEGGYHLEIRHPWSHGLLSLTVPFGQKFMVKNSLLAIAAGLKLGLDQAALQAGLRRVQLPPLRWELHRRGGNTYIFDCYNSNPGSLRAALEDFSHYPGYRVAVLGEMRELGAFSEREHRKVASAVNCDLVLTYGDEARFLADELGADIATHCPTLEDVVARLANCQNAVVLVKGSRGNQMERLLDAL